MEERVRMKSQLVEKYKDFLKYRGENMDHHYENVRPSKFQAEMEAQTKSEKMELWKFSILKPSLKYNEYEEYHTMY